jgi:hypothetical protein
MDQWERQFTEQMEFLCSQSSSRFDRFAEDTLDSAFLSISDFLERWHYDTTMPPCEARRRAFRFALTENAYVLIWFRFEGFDTLECEYEYSLPGSGRVSGGRSSVSLRSVEPEWVEAQFQSALTSFVTRFIDAGERTSTPQPAMV